MKILEVTSRYITPIAYNAPNLSKKEIENDVKEPLQPPSLEALQAYNVTFGYSCKLKKLYKAGKIKIKYSFYGGLLNKKRCSLDHIIPHSKGGKSCQANYVLCNMEQNWVRGNEPLENYINWENAERYLEQFQGVKLAGFDGDEYIRQVRKSINEAIATHR